ncbi:GDP-L-fucose synthase [bacterium]|nr:GDP-L-fucose synthase [bacterium]
MQSSDRIFIAGHRGLVGSALVRRLKRSGYTHLLTRTRSDLDLSEKSAVDRFFESEKPQYVILAAAKVGGILANATYPADFIYENLQIQTNVIHAAWQNGVTRLLFLGSSCIYPKFAPQPIPESALLAGPLEPTNRPYALAKIAGIEMCWAYNRQYGTRFFAAMPTNLYGPNDQYDPEKSHVIPALIRKMHEAKITDAPSVQIWGTGTPRREFMYSDDLADACIHLLTRSDKELSPLLSNEMPPILNIGCGVDLTIAELAQTVAGTVGYTGELIFDATKPDGTPQKRLDVSQLSNLGYTATTPLSAGLRAAYDDYLVRTRR